MKSKKTSWRECVTGKQALGPEEIAAYKENGFLHLKSCARLEDVIAISQRAKDIFSIQLEHCGLIKRKVGLEEFDAALFEFFKKHPAKFKNCGKHIQHLLSLWKLGLSEEIVRPLYDLGLEWVNICTRPVLFFNTPHLATESIYHTVPAHQDWASMEGSEDSIVAWVPLGDVPKELGAIEVVPGSHKQGLLTDRYLHGFGVVDKYSDDDFVSVETKAGDVVIFSSYLVHRSGENTTDSIRWSCHFRYNNMMNQKFIDRGFPHPYIYMPASKNK